MAPLPHTLDFASFQELHCSSANEKQTCIWYLTEEKRRCRHPLNKVNRNEAFQLRAEVLRSVPHGTSLEVLKEYARLKCCNYGHRSILTEQNLIESLARRWQGELSPRSILHQTNIPPSPTTAAESITTHEPEIYSQSAPRIIQTRLRSNQGTQTWTTGTWTDSTDSAPPEFRPYKRAGPKSVSSKLITPLTPHSKTGYVYLYTRASSPGYVKIGYSCDVQSRLAGWQRSCGYKPVLLAAFHDILICKEWNPSSIISWLTSGEQSGGVKNVVVSIKSGSRLKEEDAVKVAGQWAEWMKQAQPYGARMYLKGIWVDELERLETRGTPVTAEALLSAHSRLQLEQGLNTTEEVDENNNTTRNSRHRSLFTDDLTAEPNTDLYQVQDLANFLVGMLQFTQGFERSFGRPSQAVMTAEAVRRAGVSRTYTMDIGHTRSARQDTGATVASEA